MTDTQQLVEEYARNGSERAFRELVARYVGLVYSTALRLVRGDTHLAEDVVQTVFVDLARMAGRFSGEVMLGGWLHRHTCFVAANTMRGELRRQSRERKAMEMSSLNDPPGPGLAELGSLLDGAINDLGQRDRLAILLRFYEQRDFRAVGEALGISEDAARMRVNRSLEKLQARLKELGIGSSTTALGNTLTTQALIAVPAGLAAGISARALAAVAGLGTGAGLAPTWIRWVASGPAKIGAVLVVSALVGYNVTRPLFTRTKPSDARPMAVAQTRSAAFPTPAPRSQQPDLPDFVETPPPPPVPVPAPVAVASAVIPKRPAADALEIYASLTGRTVLHGPLPPLPGDLAEKMQMYTNVAAELLSHVLSNAGFSLILEGETFADIVPLSETNWPRFQPPAANPQSGAEGDDSTNSLQFQAIDLYTFLDVYGALIDRTMLGSSKLGAPILSLRTQTGLTRPELVYAMGTVLYLNGIYDLGDGDKFVQLLPVSEARLAKTNAPETELGAELIDPAGVPVLGLPGQNRPATLDDLMVLYGKLVDKTFQRSSVTKGAAIIFKVQTPLTKIELEYAVKTALALNGMQIVSISDGTITVIPRSRRSAQ